MPYYHVGLELPHYLAKRTVTISMMEIINSPCIIQMIFSDCGGFLFSNLSVSSHKRQNTDWNARNTVV